MKKVFKRSFDRLRWVCAIKPNETNLKVNELIWLTAVQNIATGWLKCFKRLVCTDSNAALITVNFNTHNCGTLFVFSNDSGVSSILVLHAVTVVNAAHDSRLPLLTGPENAESSRHVAHSTSKRT
jgi:hypothetical protein